MNIKLRFCRGSSLISSLIAAEEGVVMPFTPSHVEAVVPSGGIVTLYSRFLPEGYLGAHMKGGVMLRPIGYDAPTMLHELILELDDSEKHATAFYDFLSHHIGEPYDWKAIGNFADPLLNNHDPGRSICSALIALALRACEWLPDRLAFPAHRISPSVLLLVLSGRMQIPGV